MPVCRTKQATSAAAQPATSQATPSSSNAWTKHASATAEAKTNGTSVMNVHDDQKKIGWKPRASVATTRPKRGTSARSSMP